MSFTTARERKMTLFGLCLVFWRILFSCLVVLLLLLSTTTTPVVSALDNVVEPPIIILEHTDRVHADHHESVATAEGHNVRHHYHYDTETGSFEYIDHTEDEVVAAEEGEEEKLNYLHQADNEESVDTEMDSVRDVESDIGEHEPSSWSQEATEATDNQEQEEESTADNTTDSSTSSSSSSPPPPVWENGILVVTSLHDVEPVLANQRRRRSMTVPSEYSAAETDSSTNNSNNRSSLVLALIYSTDPEKCATICSIMLQRFEQANRLMQQHWETTIDNLVDDDDDNVGVEEENENDAGHRRHRRRHVAPAFAKISTEAATTTKTDATTTTLAEMLGIDFVPQLVLLVLDATDNLFLLQYAGRIETAEDIFRTCLHYYYRLVLATGTVSANGNSNAAGATATSGSGIKVLPKSFQNQSQVQAFIRDHRHGLLRYSSVPQGLAPTISPTHKAYIEWLLAPAVAENENKTDDFVLFVQCRSSHSPNAKVEQDPIYAAFDKMNSLVTNRRDRLFVTISDCNHDVMDGSVVAWKIPVDLDHDESWDDVAVVHDDHDNNHNHQLQQRQRVRQAMFVPDCANHNEQQNNGDKNKDTTTLNFVEFVIRHSTPSTLWFDRQSTAPIAFPMYRKVHAVLFVDLHHVPPVAVSGDGSIELQIMSDNATRHVRQREIIRTFRQTCQNHRQNDPVLEQDTVCLIVPSTEVRVLNTFGIDLWTPLDEQVMHLQDLMEQDADTSSSFTALEEIQLLPTLLITDQRSSGTRRYYHDRAAMDATGEDEDYGLSAFLADFWADRLTPALKTSSTRGARTNEAGVRIVTAESFTREVLENNRHALIMFKSPTCGHCKRFSVIWNQLAEFVTHVHWDSFLTLYQMDVSTDEVLNVENLTIRWVPDIAYLSPNNRGSATRYTEKDELGDGVGGIDNHMQVMEWLLQVGDFDEKELRKLLADLRRNF